MHPDAYNRSTRKLIPIINSYINSRYLVLVPVYV